MILWDADNRCYNLKRSTLEARATKQNLVGDTERFQMATVVDGEKLSIDARRQGQPLLSDVLYARFRVTLGKPDDFRPALEIEADDFIPVRSIGTKGKRLTNYNVALIEEIEPTRQPEPANEDNENNENEADDEETADIPADPDSLF